MQNKKLYKVLNLRNSKGGSPIYLRNANGGTTWNTLSGAVRKAGNCLGNDIRKRVYLIEEYEMVPTGIDIDPYDSLVELKLQKKRLGELMEKIDNIKRDFDRLNMISYNNISGITEPLSDILSESLISNYNYAKNLIDSVKKEYSKHYKKD